MAKFKIDIFPFFIFLTIFFYSSLSWAEISVLDDEGNTVILKNPANRIISLAPNITEMLFSAGAGSKIISAVPYSDYPEEAKKIPRVNAYPSIDIEKIVSLNPDLVIVWSSSSASNKIQVERMRKLGLTVFMSEPRQPIDIYNTILRFGQMASTTRVASKIADDFIKKYYSLQKKYSNTEKLNVYYQFWNKPLMTVNGKHLISNIIELCGGANVFINLHSLTPKVSVEAVIASNAEVIIAGGNDDVKKRWSGEWKPWLPLTKVKKDHIFFIEPDLISRMGPRVLQGAEQLCHILETVRKEK